MSGNTLGTLFTLTSFGESHGPAIGGVVDGCPPGLELCKEDIQVELDRRKPGTSRHVTQRKEPAGASVIILRPCSKPTTSQRDAETTGCSPACRCAPIPVRR